MADSATFLESVGGDGSTVTGDANPTTGLANGGHRARFVPALAQVVVVAENTVTKATLAKDYAEKTGATVETGTYSAKEYALGDLTATGGSAKNWAIKTDGAVSGGEFSAKSYAVGAIAAGSSKDWAIKTDGAVSGGEFSAKYHASAAATSALSASNSATAAEAAKDAAIIAKNAAEDAAETAEFWAGEAGSIATGAVKISGTDTTAGNLSSKLVVTSGLTATILNAGGNEQLQIKADGLQQEIAASSGLSYFLQGVI